MKYRRSQEIGSDADKKQSADFVLSCTLRTMEFPSALGDPLHVKMPDCLVAWLPRLWVACAL